MQGENSVWSFPVDGFDGGYDGDTFRLRLDLGFGISLARNVRLHGADTPELRGGTAHTRALGRKAREVAHEWIGDRVESGLICVIRVWRGKFGRPIIDLFDPTAGDYLSRFLIDGRYAVDYDGGDRDELLARHVENAEHHGFSD